MVIERSILHLQRGDEGSRRAGKAWHAEARSPRRNTLAGNTLSVTIRCCSPWTIRGCCSPWNRGAFLSSVV